MIERKIETKDIRKLDYKCHQSKDKYEKFQKGASPGGKK